LYKNNLNDYFYKNFYLKAVLNHQQIELTIKRLANQILENHPGLHNTVIVGIQPRGIFLSERIVKALARKLIRNRSNTANSILPFTATTLEENCTFPIKPIFAFQWKERK